MAITTVEEVRTAGQITSEYTDDEIFAEIDLTESELYDKYYLPKRSTFSIDNDYTEFYISNERVHEIVRLQISVDSSIDPSGWLTVQEGESWFHISPNKYINLGDEFISTYDGTTVRVQYIPKILNRLATDLCAWNLISTTNIVDGESVDSPLTQRIRTRINRYKEILKPKKVNFSSNYEEFNKYDYISINQTDYR